MRLYELQKFPAIQAFLQTEVVTQLHSYEKEILINQLFIEY